MRNLWTRHVGVKSRTYQRSLQVSRITPAEDSAGVGKKRRCFVGEKMRLSDSEA